MTEKEKFGAVDYVVFLGMLLMSLMVGSYYAYKDRKNKSINNYYFGGRHMSPITVGLSIAVTFVSSLTVIAIPAQAYAFGTVMVWFGISPIIQAFVACIYYIPLFQRLQISSVYEYLELRYYRPIRLTASILVIILMLFYMGTTIYLTGLALNAVTPMNFSTSIIMTAGICTVYTTLGGMKAVVWNDALQSSIMIIGVITVCIRSIVVVGGFGKMQEALMRGRRDTFWTFNTNPTEVQTIWTLFFGQGITWVGMMCSNQAITQRYQSMKTVKDARIASFVSVVPMIILMSVSAVTGCAIYAYYEGCDPVLEGKILKVDQIAPYLVMEIFRDAPGVAGLFVAAAYSGMLSTVSSGINSLAALIMEDFLIPAKPMMSERFRLNISKFLSVLFGLCTLLMAFLTEYMGQTVLQAATSLFGTFGGPILGLYASGLHFPWINKLGGMIGMISGVLFSSWIAICGIFFRKNGDIQMTPFSTANCSDFTNVTSTAITNYDVNFTTIGYRNYSTEFIPEKRPLLADSLYSISYLYYGVSGMLMTMLVSFIVSFITGFNDPKKMDPILFVPLIDNKIFPKRIIKFFRFGVPEYLPEQPSSTEKKSSFNDAAKDSSINANLRKSSDTSDCTKERLFSASSQNDDDSSLIKVKQIEEKESCL